MLLGYVEGVTAWVAQVAPILMREKSRRAREGGAADVSKDSYEKVPVEVGDKGRQRAVSSVGDMSWGDMGFPTTRFSSVPHKSKALSSS